MQHWTQVLLAEETGGSDFRETATINIPSIDYALADCWLNQVTQQGSNGSAYIQITSYVAGGDPYNGNWQYIDSAKAVTSVTFTLTVSNARAYGICRVLNINE
jgi:hypothetical protein